MSTSDWLDRYGLNQRDGSVGPPPNAGSDPLRLCVYTTVALLACVFGPVTLLAFSGAAIVGYAKARRAGLLRSKCKLGDTRLVLVYLSLVALAAAAAIPFWISLWVRMLG